MGKFVDLVKENINDKELLKEVVSKAEEFEKEYSIEGLTGKDETLEFIRKKFPSALDSHTTAAIKKHDEKRLPEIQKAEREKLEKELNPDLTPAEKELQEIKKWKAEQVLKEERICLEKELRKKAKDLGYPEDRAERFSVYGENAMTELENEADFFKTYTKDQVSTEIKTRFGDQLPPQRKDVDSSKVVNRDSYMSMSPQDQSEFVANGGSVIES